MKAREKWDLLILNHNDHQNFRMLKLRKLYV